MQESNIEEVKDRGVGLRFPVDLYATVERVARMQDRTVSQTIRRAVRLYCEAAE